MTGLAAVIARELQEWRRVFIAALAAGCLVFLAPLLPKNRNMETMNLFASIMTAGFGFGVALLAGGGLIGRELAERRMSFFFYKPLRAGSIWGGKLLAAVLLAFFSGVLVLAPTTLVGSGLLILRHSEAQAALAIMAAAILILVILGFSFQLALRSRSKWVLLDLLALLATVALLVVGMAPLDRAQAHFLVAGVSTTFGILVVLTLLISGYVGMRRGRIDLREVHKYHALTAWPIIGLLVMATLAYSAWVRSADAEDLWSPNIPELATVGSWLAVSGKTLGRGDYETTLLVNAGNGETVRTAGGWMPSQSVAFSGDGRRAVWFESVGMDPSHGDFSIKHPARLGKGRLNIATLGREPLVQKTMVFASPNNTSLKLSQDGSRLALYSGDLLTITDLESERDVASVRIPSPERVLPGYSRRAQLVFVNSNLVRIYQRSTESKLVIYEFDIQQRKLTQAGVIEASDQFSISLSSQGALALRRYAAEDLELYDARTGKFIATIIKNGKTTRGRGFLSDGRIVVAHIAAGRASLDLFSTTGTREKTIDLGPAQGLRLGNEAEPGKLIVALSPTDPQDFSRYRKTLTTHLVDLNSGQIRKLGSSLVPIAPLWWFSAEPGTVATRLFVTNEDQIVYYDPATGEQRLIAGRAMRKGATS